MSCLIDFFNRLERVFASLPEKTALCTDVDKDTITYAELDAYSGKVYRYLKEHGIGREDIVMLWLPRSTMAFAAMLGVWKAGAAFVVAETTTAKERMDYIRNDCGCKCFLDEETLSKALMGEFLPGREKVDKHDLAYLIYTSGSTGNPKGVLHEYGNIDKIFMTARCDGEPLVSENTVTAYNSSLSFVAAVQELVDNMGHGATLVLVPTQTVRNLPALMELYERTGVTFTFMTPSMFRTCRNFNSQLQTVVLSAEPCSGVQSDRIRLINAYSSSEGGRLLCTFRINRSYDKTPVGKNQGGEEILLLNEDGRAVPEGEAGEICYKNEYMRGYHHLSERNAEVIKDGLFHSGDLGFRDSYGNITILGRKDDMIKINGNRVEPGETAAAVKEILGLSWCAARGFVTDGGRAYLCVYYLKGCVFDENELRQKLRSRLPYYMIPAYFIAIDEIPLLPTGKLNRRALPEPVILNLKGDYEPPENETEAKIIAEMEKALGIHQIGRRDSFRNLGGDSVAAMMIASALTDVIPDTACILTCDTPAEIAKAALQHVCSENGTIRPAKIADSYEISTGVYFFYSIPNDPLYMRSEFRMTKEVEPERLQEAADAMLKEIPYLSLKMQRLPDGSRYLLVPNDRPFSVIQRDDYAPVFSDEAREYLFTISCCSDTIRISIFHGLTDGAGMRAVTKCLLKHYLRLSGSIPGTDKTDFGTCNYDDPHICLEKLTEPKHHIPYFCPATLAFSDIELDTTKQINSLICFSISSAMNIARNSEGSLQAILSIALGEAIYRASGGIKKQITISCPMDLRSRLNCPHTLRNCTLSYRFNISEKLLSFPFPDKLSAVKGMQYLQDDPGFWIPKCLSVMKNERRLNAYSTIEGKNNILISNSSTEKVGYPVVSFLGNLELDDMYDQIRTVRCTTNVSDNAGIMLVVYLIRERCYVSICSNVIDSTWKTHFISILREAGLDVSEIDD